MSFTLEDLESLISEVEADLSLNLNKSEAFIEQEQEDQPQEAEVQVEEQIQEPEQEISAQEEQVEEPAQAEAEAVLAEEGQSEENLADLLSQMEQEELLDLISQAQLALEQKQPQQEPELEAQPEIEKNEILDKPNGDLPVKKSETDSTEVLSKAEKALKDQKEVIAAQKAQIEELSKGLEDLTAALSKSLPARKDITNIKVLAKSEGEFEGEEKLEKSEKEIYQEAVQLTKSNLSKSERDVLNAYFMNRKEDKAVRELLTKKK